MTALPDFLRGQPPRANPTPPGGAPARRWYVARVPAGAPPETAWEPAAEYVGANPTAPDGPLPAGADLRPLDVARVSDWPDGSGRVEHWFAGEDGRAARLPDVYGALRGYGGMDLDRLRSWAARMGTDWRRVWADCPRAAWLLDLVDRAAPDVGGPAAPARVALAVAVRVRPLATAHPAVGPDAGAALDAALDAVRAAAAGAQPTATLDPHLAAVVRVREAYSSAAGVRPASVLHALQAVEWAVIVARTVDGPPRAPGALPPWYMAGCAASQAEDARATAAALAAVPRLRIEQTAWEMRQADEAHNAAAEAEGRAQVALLAAEFLPLPAVLLALDPGLS